MLTRRTSLLALAALAACAPAERADVIDAAAFAAWLDRYKQAWEARDAALAGALFTEDASYHEMPFDAPMQGRAAIEAMLDGAERRARAIARLVAMRFIHPFEVIEVDVHHGQHLALLLRRLERRAQAGVRLFPVGQAGQ